MTKSSAEHVDIDFSQAIEDRIAAFQSLITGDPRIALFAGLSRGH